MFLARVNKTTIKIIFHSLTIDKQKPMFEKQRTNQPFAQEGKAQKNTAGNDEPKVTVG